MPQLDESFNVRATLRGKKPGTVISPIAADPLKDYELCEQVGHGSYGKIFRAISRKGPQIVALKIIDLEKTEDDIEDLLFEVDFQAKCDSPYLAKYYGSYLWENKLSIAMEYLGGGTLEELITNCDLTESQISFILKEILRALYYLHCTFKIHRDIKPANVIFDSNGCLKLADFGVAASLGPSKRSTNTFVGTPIYLAPEIILSKGYDSKVDIWSLGIMAIEVATKTAPRAKEHPMDILYAIPVDPPPTLPETFSPDFRDFISNCTIKDPQRRPSAKELLNHPFIAKSETLDRNRVKKSLEYRLTKNDDKTPTDSTSHLDQDDWWVQYTKSAFKKIKSAAISPTISHSSLAKPKGPSAQARLSVRPEMARLNPTKTFGKKNSGFLKGKSQHPLFEPDTFMKRQSIKVVTTHGTASNLKSTPPIPTPPTPVGLQLKDRRPNLTGSEPSISPAKIKQQSIDNISVRNAALSASSQSLQEATSTNNNDKAIPKCKSIGGMSISSRPNTSSSTSKVGTHILSKQFRENLKPEMNIPLSKQNITYLRFLSELYDTEVSFSNKMEDSLKLYLQTLLNSKGGTIREVQAKELFGSIIKIHTFSTRTINEIETELGLLEREEDIEKGVLMTLDSMSNEIEINYRDYGGQFTKISWEFRRLCNENIKFREFLVGRQNESSLTSEKLSLFELLTLPLERLRQYAKLFKESLIVIKNPKLPVLSNEVSSLLKEVLFMVNENCPRLINMMLKISDIPPAIILKPQQKLVLQDNVQKLVMKGSKNVKVKNQAVLYLMRDTIVLVKVISKEETANGESSNLNDISTLEMILNPTIVLKPPKQQSRKYRRVIPVDFAEIQLLPDKEQTNIKNIFSIRLGSKVSCFSASSAKVKDDFVRELS